MIDPQQHGVRFGILQNTIAWQPTCKRDSIFFTLQKLLARQTNVQLDAVVVCADAHTTTSWSLLRTAVAIGNTVAYARHIPVLMCETSRNEFDTLLAENVTAAAYGTWAIPPYNAEPHITQPRA